MEHVFGLADCGERQPVRQARRYERVEHTFDSDSWKGSRVGLTPARVQLPEQLLGGFGLPKPAASLHVKADLYA